MTGEPDVVAEFYTRNKAEAPKAEAILQRGTWNWDEKPESIRQVSPSKTS